MVVALSGDLGAGKTTFVRGFLKGAGARGRATSPTFVIMRRHPLGGRAGRGGAIENAGARGDIYHIDAYRLKSQEDLAALGFGEIAADKNNLILIEWAEKIKKILPRDTVWLRFRHGKKANERTVSIQ